MADINLELGVDISNALGDIAKFTQETTQAINKLTATIDRLGNILSSTFNDANQEIKQFDELAKRSGESIKKFGKNTEKAFDSLGGLTDLLDDNPFKLIADAARESARRIVRSTVNIAKAFSTRVVNAAKKAASTIRSVFRRVFNALTDLRTLVAGGLGFVGVGFAINAVTDAAIEQENAVKDLTASLEANNELTQENVDSTLSFASALQDTTGVGDETTIRLVALAQSYGASNEQAKLAAEAAIEFAAATGKDVDTAINQVVKTFGGFAGELGEVNVAVKNLTREQLQAGEAARVLIDQFGGRAAARLNTFSGAVGATQGRLGDFLESVGEIITQNPVLIRLIGRLGDAFQRLEKFVDDNQDQFRRFLNRTIVGALKAFRSLLRSIRLVSKAFDFEITDPFSDVSDSITTISELLDKLTDKILEVRKFFLRAEREGQRFARQAAARDRDSARRIDFSAGLTKRALEEQVEANEEAEASFKKQIETIDTLRQGLANKIQREKFPSAFDGLTDPTNFETEAEKELSNLIESLQDQAANTPLKIPFEFVGPPTPAELDAMITPEIDPATFVGPVAPGDTETEKAFAQFAKRLEEDRRRESEELAKFGSDLNQAGQNILAGSKGAEQAAGQLVAASTTLAGVPPEIAGQLAPFFTLLAGASEEQVRAQVKAFAEALPPAIAAIIENAGVLIDALADNADEIIIALIKALPSVARALINLIPNVVKSLGQSLQDLFRAQFNIVFDQEKLSGILDQLAEDFVLQLESLPTDIGESLVDAVRFLDELGVSIRDSIRFALPDLLKANRDGIVAGFEAGTSKFLGGLEAQFTKLTDALSDVFTPFFVELRKLFLVEFPNVFVSIFNSLIDSLNDIVSNFGVSLPGGGGGGFLGTGIGAREGLVVPPGFPNDSFGPVFMQSGELVTPENKMREVVRSESTDMTETNTLLAAIASRMEGGSAAEISIAEDGLSDILLRLSRRNERTAVA